MIGSQATAEPTDAAGSANMRPSRILYIHLAPDLYGASRALLHLLAALDRRLFTPLVALPEAGPLSDELRALAIEPIIAPHIRVLMGNIMRSWRIIPFGLSLLPAGLAMRRLIRRHTADLVHSNTWTTLSGALGAQLADVPHVWHIREILPAFGGIKPLLVKFSLRRAERVLCISESVAAQFYGQSGAERVRVIFDGLPFSGSISDLNVEAAIRRHSNSRAGELRIGMIGRLHPQKGQDDFLRACALLRPKLPAACRFLIVGGPQPGYEQFGDELRTLAGTLGIADQVDFLGFITDTQPLIASLDILALPATRPEGLGGVLLEAMAAGVPVVATRAGGPAEIIDSGSNGFLTDPRQPEQLAAALQLLLEDASLRCAIGAAGRQTVVRRFDITRTAAQVQQVYHELL